MDTVRTRDAVKAFFQTNDIPTQQEFYDLLASIFFKGDLIPQGNINGDLITLTYATPIVWDLAVGRNAKVTLTGNSTLSISNLTQGFVYLEIIQDATGGRTLTLPANSTVGYGGAGVITLSAAANAIDTLSGYWNGTKWRWLLNKNFT